MIQRKNNVILVTNSPHFLHTTLFCSLIQQWDVKYRTCVRCRLICQKKQIHNSFQDVRWTHHPDYLRKLKTKWLVYTHPNFFQIHGQRSRRQYTLEYTILFTYYLFLVTMYKWHHKKMTAIVDVVVQQVNMEAIVVHQVDMEAVYIH